MSPFVRRTAWLVLLGSGSAWAGPPFFTDDPEPAPEGHYETYLFSTGTRTHAGFEGAAPGYEVNYGAGPDLQIAGAVEQSLEKPRGGSSDWHYGGAEFGIKYRFLHEDEDGWRPQVSFYPSVELSEGSSKPSVFLPLWAQKSFGEWEVFGGGGIHLNTEPGARNTWSTGIAALHPITEELSLGAEIFHETAEVHGDPASTGFNLAALYEFNERWSLIGSAGRGLQSASETNQFSYYIGLGFTFP